MPRGGKRLHSGRKSVYPGKTHRASMVFTATGRALLHRLTRRTKLSRSDVIGHLLGSYTNAEVPRYPPDPFPGKVHTRLKILLNPEHAQVLIDLHLESGQSQGVIGEFLVRTYGATTTYPKKPSATRKG